MPKNPEDTSNSNRPERKLSRDETYYRLRQAMRVTQPTFEHFEYRNLKMFSDEEIQRDRERLNKRLAKEKDKSDPEASALESMVAYAIQSRELFSCDAYAFLGSTFDDRFNGADVVCGFPKRNPDGRDLVFTLDVTSETGGETSIKKFQKGDEFSQREINPLPPYTGRVSYFEHDKTRTRISGAPHYVVGADPRRITRSADKFRFGDKSMYRESDPDFDARILFEIHAQSELGMQACAKKLEETPDKRIEKAKLAHQEIFTQTTKELYKLFGLKYPDDKEAFDVKYQKVLAILLKNDTTFNHIYSETERRKEALNPTEQKHKRFGAKAGDIARKTVKH